MSSATRKEQRERVTNGLKEIKKDGKSETRIKIKNGRS
jgi:hypothetical protein